MLLFILLISVWAKDVKFEIYENVAGDMPLILLLKTISLLSPCVPVHILLLDKLPFVAILFNKVL